MMVKIVGVLLLCLVCLSGCNYRQWCEGHASEIYEDEEKWIQFKNMLSGNYPFGSESESSGGEHKTKRTYYQLMTVEE